jgi:hypothetical protein
MTRAATRTKLRAMAWSIATAAAGTSCRIDAKAGSLLPVVAYRINDDGDTDVLVAPLHDEPEWVPLDELDVLASPVKRSTSRANFS